MQLRAGSLLARFIDRGIRDNYGLRPSLHFRWSVVVGCVRGGIDNTDNAAIVGPVTMMHQCRVFAGRV